MIHEKYIFIIKYIIYKLNVNNFNGVGIYTNKSLLTQLIVLNLSNIFPEFSVPTLV